MSAVNITMNTTLPGYEIGYGIIETTKEFLRQLQALLAVSIILLVITVIVSIAVYIAFRLKEDCRCCCG